MRFYRLLTQTCHVVRLGTAAPIVWHIKEIYHTVRVINFFIRTGSKLYTELKTDHGIMHNSLSHESQGFDKRNYPAWWIEKKHFMHIHRNNNLMISGVTRNEGI